MPSKTNALRVMNKQETENSWIVGEKQMPAPALHIKRISLGLWLKKEAVTTFCKKKRKHDYKDLLQTTPASTKEKVK